MKPGLLGQKSKCLDSKEAVVGVPHSRTIRHSGGCGDGLGTGAGS